MHVRQSKHDERIRTLSSEHIDIEREEVHYGAEKQALMTRLSSSAHALDHSLRPVVRLDKFCRREGRSVEQEGCREVAIRCFAQDEQASVGPMKKGPSRWVSFLAHLK